MKINHPFVSVIVPVYNTENYVSKCLKSIGNQTYKSIEIIIVNDCSSDNSYKLCRDFEKTDRRVKVLSHEKNKGVSAALNTALEKAVGQFIMFVDSDDWIDNDGIEYLVNLVKLNPSTDLIRSFNRKVWETGKSLEETIESSETIMDRNSFLETRKIGGFISSLFVKREIIKNNNLKFDESLKIKMDLVFNWQCKLNSKNIIISKNVYYNYLQRSSSLIHSVSFEKAKNHLKASELVFNYSNLFSECILIKKIAKEYLVNGLVDHVSSLKNLPFAERKNIRYFQTLSNVYSFIKKHNIVFSDLKFKNCLRILYHLLIFSLPKY